MAPNLRDYPPVIGNYLILDSLGSGFSGSIFRASHIHTGHIVALKVQDVDHECPTNRYERFLYPLLQGGIGMPTLWASGIYRNLDYLAIDLLGPSLDNLYRKAGLERMDLRSVLCIGIQVINRLEFMHTRGVLHRDIQLGNCVLGLPGTINEQTIYMIDFGFSKRYIEPFTKRHIPDSKAKRDFIGNYWFSSVGVHCKGKVPSRRDDLEAVALMLIHLLTPRGLSWTRNGIPKTDYAHERLKREKEFAHPEDLCAELPEQFEDFLRYCRRLKFQECPDYQHWATEFRELLREEGFSTGAQFIWPPPGTAVVKASKPALRRALDATSLEKVLNDLAKLDVQDRPILGDRRNIASAVQRAKDDAKKHSDEGLKKPKVPEPVKKPPSLAAAALFGWTLDNRAPPKAEQLRKLTLDLSGATGNVEIAEIVTRFVSVLLHANGSRKLTKEGIAFLETLCKQLGEHGKAIPRWTRSSSDKEQLSDQSGATEEVENKLRVVARLRRDVGLPTCGRQQLAKLVAEFGAMTTRSNGRTVTKDGFGFLEGLAGRLKALA